MAIDYLFVAPLGSAISSWEDDVRLIAFVGVGVLAVGSEPPGEPHSHGHVHGPLRHSHAHFPDMHHRHQH